jgi:hypothetical protein
MEGDKLREGFKEKPMLKVYFVGIYGLMFIMTVLIFYGIMYYWMREKYLPILAMFVLAGVNFFFFRVMLRLITFKND